MNDELILNEIHKNGLYKTIKEINIPNNFFITNSDKVSFSLLWNFIEFGDYDIDENFLEDCIAHDLIKLDKLFELPMLIYSKLSDNFISKYSDNINWYRMLLYKISDEKVNIFDYEDIIIKNDLWQLISSIELPYEFMDKYIDKLNWSYLYMIKDEWSDNDLERYPELLLYITSHERKQELKKIDQINF